MTPDLLDTGQAPDAVDALIAEYLLARDRGQAPARADWLALHSEDALELALFLDDLERMTPVRTLAHPARTVQTDETHLLTGGKPTDKPTRRESETVLWDGLTDPDIPAQSATTPIPFHGSFGDYDLLETVARGGMGVVFKARHRQLGRVVALKMILAGQLADAQHVQRFRAEAQAAAKLDHPGIVPVFEVGAEKGLHYFTMAFVNGKSLAERLRDGPLAAKDAARLVRDLAAAVAYAHEHGIVHRDLKPANVLIDALGQPKLTDFGLAKQTQGASEMTGTGQILGTPSYMSPEQAQGDAATVGPAADVYGLGALLFALLTGRPPFQSSSPFETIQHVISAEPPKPRLLNPSVSRDLETICLKCLEKSPEKRYASALALQEDLARFLDDRPILARPVGIIEMTYRWYRHRPVVGTMAATLAALLIAVPVLLGFFLVEAEARATLEAHGHVKEKVAREKVEAAHDKTKAAERERTQQLFEAYVNEAAARRTSPRLGRRFDTLDRLAAARELADELKLPAAATTRLRSEAISALSLVDLQATAQGAGWLRSWEPLETRFVDGKGAYLAWDKPNAVLVRRLSDNRILHRLPVEKAGLDYTKVRLSYDNRFVVCQAQGKIVVWRVDGAKPAEIAWHDDVSSAMFAPDRPEIIVHTVQRELVIVPLEEKKQARTIRIPAIIDEPWPSTWDHLCVPGPRGQVAVAGVKRVHVVDLDAGKLKANLGTPGQVQSMDWSPDGATVAASCPDQGVVLFQPASNSQRLVKTTVAGPELVVFDPSGRYLLVTNVWTGHTVLLNVELGAAELRFNNSELANSDAESRQERGLWWWWRGDLDTPHRVLPGLRDDGVTSEMAVHPGGRLLATTTTLGITLTDLGTGKRLGWLPRKSARLPRFDAAGNLYALGHLENVGQAQFRWPVSTQGNRYDIGVPERLPTPTPALGIDISADGRLVASSTWNSAAVLDRQTGKTVREDTQRGVRRVAISPDGLLVASFGWDLGSDGFRVWEAKTGKVVHLHRKGLTGFGQFTPDGRYLISRANEEKELMLWSVADWKLVRTLGPQGEFAISPDSRYVGVAELNGKARLTRIADGEPVARFDAPGEEYLSRITFSPDGRFLVATTIEQNKHHVWDLWHLRRQLAELKLDWEKDAPPPAPPAPTSIELEIAPAK